MKLTKKQLVAVCQIALAIFAFCMLFVTCVKFKVDAIIFKTEASYSGFEAYFGTPDELKASAGGVLTVIFLGLIFVLAVLKLIFPKFGKLVNLVIILLGIAATIFLFSSTTTFMINLDSEYVTLKNLNPTLGAGAIVAAIITIVNVAGSILDEFFIKK